MKLVCGVGTNDANYVVTQWNCYTVDGVRYQRLIWRCPFHTKWLRMLQRCYGVEHKAYLDVQVCQEWLTFSNFKSWMETQDWEGKELDKDLLGDGSLYSPETCCFVDHQTNMFLIDRREYRGLYLPGVYYDRGCGKYRAQIKSPRRKAYIGVFSSEEAAHNAWLVEKRLDAMYLAEIQSDSRVAQKLIEFAEEV